MITARIKRQQYLDTNGILNRPLPAHIDNREQLIELYQTLVTTRLFDEAAVNLQRTGIIGTYAQSRGQEAIGGAIGKAMLCDDVFIPYYRDIATQIQRGVRLEEILQYWGGDERGSCFAKQKHDFPLCVPIATQFCHAIGVAFALKQRANQNVAVVTGGDGSTSKGDFYEAINIAGAMSLPCLFVINNNQWAISVPIEHQTAAETIAHKAYAAGIESTQIEGNDPIAMLVGVQQALEKIRHSGKPFFIEAISYRICDHTTADDATRYMQAQALQDAIKKEPLIRYKKFLCQYYDWSNEEDLRVYHDSQQVVHQAVEDFQLIKQQQDGEFFDYMYQDLPVDLAEQKQTFLDELKRHE